MATITFDIVNRFIQLGVGDIFTNAQELSDAIRTFEALLTNLDLPTMMDGSGKGQISPTEQTGILLTLLDGWKIRADDTFAVQTVVVVKGDIITDVVNQSPFIPVNNVSYDRGLSTAPSITTVAGGSTKRSLNV